MKEWRVDEGPNGLRLSSVTRRALGAEQLTWADLLLTRLSAVQVYVLYFPSRFDLELDSAVQAALRIFGRQTGPGTSVNFWDPADPEFSRALAFFSVDAPPALVLATGLKARGRRRLARGDLYAIIVADPKVLGDREHLAAAVNGTHEVLLRGDPGEIARHVRERAASSLLATIGSIAERLRDELVRLKPRFQLPGGVSIQVG